MSVTSIGWLATMLASIAFYWIIPGRHRQIFLVSLTAAFLAMSDMQSLLLLSLLTCTSYGLLSLKLHHKTAIAIFCSLAVLGYYKIQANSGPLDTIKDYAIPLGLSYYTFRVIHYIIERSRGGLKEHGFFDYVAYLFFLPTILAGPIHRFPAFLKSYRNHVWKAEHISGGLERILIGYFKVVVLGNFISASFVAPYIGRALEQSQALGFYLEAIRGSLNLYFLFAGFSDIAIGFALMLGYRVMENFNFPFFKTNVAEFWRCWHISLTSWAREYVFMTVLSIFRNPYLATVSSLLCIGLWHEISPRYIFWGFYHGLGIIVVMQWGRIKRKLIPIQIENRFLIYAIDFFNIFLTANFFFISYILINQPTLTESAKIISIVLFSWMG